MAEALYKTRTEHPHTDCSLEACGALEGAVAMNQLLGAEVQKAGISANIALEGSASQVAGAGANRGNIELS